MFTADLRSVYGVSLYMTLDQLFKCIVYLHITVSCSYDPTTVFKTVLLSFLGVMFFKVGSEDPDGSFCWLLGVDTLFSLQRCPLVTNLENIISLKG